MNEPMQDMLRQLTCAGFMFALLGGVLLILTCVILRRVRSHEMKLILLGIAAAAAGTVLGLSGFSENLLADQVGGALRLASPLEKIGVILVLAGVAGGLLRASNCQTTGGNKDTEEGADDA